MTKIEEAKRLLDVVRDLWVARNRAKEADHANDLAHRDLFRSESTLAERMACEARRERLFRDACDADDRLRDARSAYFGAMWSAASEWFQAQGLPRTHGDYDELRADFPELRD